MKGSCIVLVIFVSTLLLPQYSEAKKGIASLFKLGRGISAVSGIKSYDKNTLTVRELKQCILLERDIGNPNDELSIENEVLSLSEVKLGQLESQINDLNDYLITNKDVTLPSQYQINKYNELVSRHNFLLSQYHHLFEKHENLQSNYNNQIDLYNEKIYRFKKNCDNKSYYENDLQKATVLLNQ